MALRFGFAGFQHGHIYSLHKKVVETDGFEVVAAGDDQTEAREEASAKGVAITHESVDDLIANADCDVIAIGDYFARRGSLAIAALKAGKHAIADKPLCTSLEEIDEMDRLTRETGLKVGCMLTMRGSRQMNGLRNLIREGAIGEVHAISFGGQHPLNLGSRAKWYFEPGKHGGTITDIGIHAIDAIPWMTGLEYETVNAARCWNAFAPDYPHFEDGGQMMLTMNNGCGVLGDVSYFMPDAGGYSSPYYWRTTIWGRDGVLEAATASKVITQTVDGELVERPLADGNENYFDQFVKDIQGEDVALNADAVIHSMRTVLKIQQAADEGLREVKL
ncbi:MAG: Gfo/Idh/MocA family oxidoreductase [Candidatus Latescibacteria bacterium]|jgi:predicted dehydrogenase|nr:Gfo/Idh/MocA family oxidoreductase [Candidatus Latescibacterota bacterium]